MNNIVKPRGNHEKFRGGIDIVVPDDISSIKITASENRLHRRYSMSKEQERARIPRVLDFRSLALFISRLN